MVDILEHRVVSTPPFNRRTQRVITLGLEEELQVVDADGALAPHDIARGQAEVPDADGASSREFHRCALEIKTPVCATPDAIVRSLAGMRRIAAERARRQGQRVLSAALHPFSHWTQQAAYDDPVEFPRYARLCDEYGDVIPGAMSFGMHVHLACSDETLRMPVMNALRNVLPEVLALSASSPFCEGRDTGLESWRHGLLERLPRSGIPAIWADETEYRMHLERLRKVGTLRAGEGLWEDLRLHHVYGTLEVRVADAMHSLDRIWLIVALLQAEVATLEAEIAQGWETPPVETALLEDSKFRVRRHGMNARVVDWHTDTVMPMPERLQRWLERVSPAARRLGTLPRLATALGIALGEGTSAQMQRAWFAAGAFPAVIDKLVAATAAPLSSHLAIEGV